MNSVCLYTSQFVSVSLNLLTGSPGNSQKLDLQVDDLPTKTHVLSLLLSHEARWVDRLAIRPLLWRQLKETNSITFYRCKWQLFDIVGKESIWLVTVLPSVVMKYTMWKQLQRHTIHDMQWDNACNAMPTCD